MALGDEEDLATPLLRTERELGVDQAHAQHAQTQAAWEEAPRTTISEFVNDVTAHNSASGSEDAPGVLDHTASTLVQEQDDECRAQEANGEQVSYIHEDDLYTPKELVRTKDVLQIIEEEGVARLGEFDVPDHLVISAMCKENLLTVGTEHLDVDWKTMWTDILASRGRKQRAGWSKPTIVQAHVVTIRDAAAEGPRGLLQPLLKRHQTRGSMPVTVFGLPAVHAVIHHKWHTWAFRFLIYELTVYMAWLLAFTAFTLLFEYEDETETLGDLVVTVRGCATLGCSAAALLAMVPFTYMEACTISAYGTGWWNVWNVLDMARYLLQLLITAMHLHRPTLAAHASLFPVLLSVQHLLLWTKLHDWARVFAQKNLLVDTMRIVLSDMAWFLIFMALTMLGFAFAFFVLFRQDRDAPDFTNFWHACASMVSYLLAMFDFNIFYSTTNQPAVFTMFLLFEFIMYITLLNIMIAIMTSSFTKTSQDEGPRFLASRAMIIDELETTLPRWLKRHGGATWFPAFVHVLKLHPASSFEDVNLGSVLSGIGALERNLLNA